MRIGDGAAGGRFEDIEAEFLDFSRFEQVVGRFCKTIGARCGLSGLVDPVELLKAHNIWRSECSRWLTSGVMPSSSVELSHFKSFGILLYSLAECPFVTYQSGPSVDPWEDVYGSLRIADEQQIQRVKDGQHYYLAWLFCYEIVEAYERDRTDRRTKYISRITEDFELDMVSHLISGKYTPDSLYMVLKALFFRE